ncbi:hypothetical protein [Sandarakinorhabdus oryzae]|uniref:hypothetical protein n=1 Tax=Sandarakinorhabdus oryzae TaxID=2675220 RepID=UPI001F3AA645|nr:hypothetical protein [Sandarakinorhabdus oryzae]
MMRAPIRRSAALALVAVPALLLAGCERNPLIVKRSACPAVAVAAYASDATLFKPGGQDVANLDAVATITNVRDECTETADQYVSRIRYDVIVRRTDTAQARQIVLPVFSAVVQAGNIINAKQISSVAVNFAAGQERALASGTATASVARSAASVPQAILDKINRLRRPGELDAATDPMADPEVRAALRAASFEVVLGFQLDDRSLAYNIAK